MKIRKITALILALSLCISCLSLIGCDQSLGNPKEVVFTGEIRDISSLELIKEIKTGWNLGNTFDAPSETAWGNPATTLEMMQAVKEAGFDAVRVPVTWGGHLEKDLTIKEDYLNRVQEVVDYVLSTGMFCIVNTHHEDWLFPDDEHAEQNVTHLTEIWSQISERFKDYNEKLIFESMNEPRLRDTPDEWNGGNQSARTHVHNLNMIFVNIVRNSSGNNDKRHLMIPSYAASAEQVALDATSMTFSQFEGDGKIIVSVHAYTPYSFALQQPGTDKWSADLVQSTQDVDWLFDRLEKLFVSKNIPVILGETGAMIKNDNLDDRVEWAGYYFGKAHDLGIPAFWWDNGNFSGGGELFGILNRSEAKFAFPEIVDAITK